jgi:hypothetical protein
MARDDELCAEGGVARPPGRKEKGERNSISFYTYFLNEYLFFKYFLAQDILVFKTIIT